MPPDNLFTDSLEFLKAVAALRPMHPRYREMALYAADWWDDAEFVERLLRADLPAEPAPSSVPHLKLVQ